MKYSAVHKGLVVKQSDLERLANSAIEAMRIYREVTNTPLGKRERKGPLSGIDHAERELLLGLNALGVDIGAQWGHELDLSENP